MKRLFCNPGAGLLPNSQAGYWLSLLLFGILIVSGFILFETPINNTLQTINSLLSEGAFPRPVAVFLLIGLLAFDALLPVPSSVVALIAVTALGAIAGSLVIFFGLCLGAVLGYFLGAGYFHALTRGLNTNERQRAARFSTRLTTWALVLLRGVPVLAEASVIAAGISGYPFRQFLIVTTLANLGLAVAYGYIGLTLAGQESLLLAVVACMLLPALLLAARGLKRGLLKHYDLLARDTAKRNLSRNLYQHK